ncbi:MAG: hypothetical protein RLZZ132_805 [Bacteroidota bacterium]|jgi:hypothetical protein|uniref:DUF4249 domain-containing protein n=1 Tax=Aquirufa novilacunae TaxID=3139305 RepID=A0ABW8SYJ4_9BACT
MRHLLLIFCALFLLSSCETEIEDFQTQNLSSAIVVYGEISNVDGPYNVRLNYVSAYSPYDATQFTGQPITDANVRIVDGNGKETAYYEKSKGYYLSPAGFKGEVGQKYKLRIKLLDGKTIESAFQTITPSPSLAEFSYSFKDAAKVENMRFPLIASIKDPKATEDYYFVKRQDFRQFLLTCPPPPAPPAPTPPCNCLCWQAPLNTTPYLLDDFLLSGKNLSLDLGQLPYEDFTDWVVQLDVYSISKEAHTYWKRLEDQRKLSGGIFDKVPAQIIGNLKCTSEPSQEVLGFFMVGGLTQKRLQVDRFNGIPTEAYQKLLFYVDFNNIRYKDIPLWNCKDAAFIKYNLGYSLPPL